MMTNLRYELKMVCDPHLQAQARAWIRLHPAGFRETYPARQVNNLYLDTPHLNSFNANQAGISARQKLRLRWYGDAGAATTVNPTLELKLKENLLGDKKQQILNCVVDWQRPYSHILQTIHNAAGPEWGQWLDAAAQPILINWYRREYFATYDGAIRATLDYAQAAYDQRMSARPNFERPSPLPNLVVIEMKAVPDDGERLQAAMAHFPIPRSRNSKYVNGIAAAWK
ncbi:MAG: VTC domain-containing protein [Chloroflexi bacterium]|nr:VTC domain-containing protein [Chloroflexota bacterium]